MASDFKQSATSMLITSGFTFDVYLWSTAANWASGVPANGAAVNFNITGGGNPSGYDDLGSLFLDSLDLVSGFVAVGGSAGLAHGASLEISSLSFGSTIASVYSDTDLGSPAATLVVDGFSGSSGGRIGAFGANALTVVRSTTDPGEIYQVDGGGELVLSPTPHAAAASNIGFYYQDSGTPAGTFDFLHPGGTINVPLAGVAIGDSIALPGSDVASVTFGSTSISVVTNLGTTVFSDVSYSGTQPTGYTVSADPQGGERITFASQQATSFKQTTTTALVDNGFTFGVYLWSTTANWTAGVPTAGAAATFNITGGGNPSGYDDLSSLFLDSLDVASGFVAVGGSTGLAHGASLEISSLSFGSTIASVYSDTDLGSPAATLVVDGFSGSSGGRIGAFGANALTVVRSTTDPGEIYQVDSGGELVLSPTPHAAAASNIGFYYQNSGSPAGTFDFLNPGGTINVPLAGVAIGDSIALPGTDIASVTFGSTSISVVSDLGTTTFSDVSYSGTHPTGYTVSADPQGGERITFASQQATSFKQATTTNIVDNGFTFGVYLWSTTANWIGGMPTAGAAATFNITGGGNPSGYDDLSSLFLDSLDIAGGFVAVGGSAGLAHGASLEISSLSFGSTLASVYSDTDLGSPAATLVVDGFSGSSGGRIGAFGANALTVVRSSTDPGEIYQVDSGGELVLSPTPHAANASNIGFYYQNSGSPAGTFDFLSPGGTINVPLAGVAIGDAIALPGTDVASVTFGSTSISVVTNLGTTTFSDVSYSGTHPTGYTVSTDPQGGERVTFASQQATSFKQATTTALVESGFTFGVYLWSTTANWTAGVPTTGAAATFNITGGGNPSGYDDLGSLFLDSLDVASGFVAVGGSTGLAHGASLEISSLSFGSTIASVYSDTDLGSPAATLVVDGFSGSSGGRIGAFGANALTVVRGSTDPGEIYQVDSGGELVLTATPHAANASNIGFYYQDSGTPSGTFAFVNPGSTISVPLAGVAIGDSIALPGTDVASVTYGPTSITVATNLGTTTFSDVSYMANETFTGFTTSTDTATGLERITFAGHPSTSFQQTTTTALVESGFTFGVYLWSTTANWIGGVPVNNDDVTFNITGGPNPSGYDDLSSLFLDSLTLTSGFVAVGGSVGLTHGASLEIATLGFGSTVASVYSDTDLGSPGATLVVDGFTGAGYGRIGAFGANALTMVRSTSDPGEIYQVDGGGELVLTPTPLGNPGTTNVGFYYQDSGSPAGTFAFVNPGSTIALPLAGTAIGDSIALPGSYVTGVTYGSTSILVRTSAGNVTFSDVSFSGTAPTGFVATTDPISGLERITFTGQQSVVFQQGTTSLVGSTPDYVWSNSANWTGGIVPVSGYIVTANVPGSTFSAPGGYDDIANLYLDRLTVSQGYLAVGGTLTVASLSVAEAGSRGIFADTLPNGGAASLTIDSLSFNGAVIGAEGTHAVTTVLAPIDPAEIYQAADGGTIVLAAAPKSTSELLLNLGDTASDTGTIALINPGGTVAALLGNVGVGDAIELPGTSVSSVTYGAGTLTVLTNVGTTVFSDVTYLSGSTPQAFIAAADASTGLEKITFTACFRAGTLIRTVDGDVPVEELAVGTLVPTEFSGVAPVVWVGHRHIDCRRHPEPHKVWPVRVTAGAFGEGLPRRDLFLSPDHAVFVADVLVPIKHLINGSTIAQLRVDDVAYYHVELPEHDVLTVEGLAAESYLDSGTRSSFTNADGPIQLFPDFSTRSVVHVRLWESCGCAPLIVTGARLRAIRQCVAAQDVASQPGSITA